MNVRNERLETPLMLCCQSETDIEEKRRVVTYLLGKKSKVNLQDIYGRTALIYASLSNSGNEIIKALLDARSNPWIQDESKNTVFDYVINAGDLETTRLLINACRENMQADERDNGQMEHLEECLANIQDLRKFSWPLMGPRLRRNHTHVYAAEKEEPSISSNNLLGSDLEGDNISKSPQPERRRKKSVCHFDPLDIQEILNCNERTETKGNNKETQDDSNSESRKTSVRSLSEEERFTFHISDSESAPRDPLSGLEKLLKLRDSFDLTTDECTYATKHSPDDITRSPSAADQQDYEDKNSFEQNKGDLKLDKEGKAGSVNSASRDENQVVLNGNSKSDGKVTEEDTKECERLFTHRISVSKNESCTSSSETSTKRQGQAMINSTLDTGKTGLENTESSSNPYTSLVTSHQSSPVMSPLPSPPVTRRQTVASATVKQSISPRASPLTVLSEQNRREVSIVRRYTLSAMDMGKLHSTGAGKTLLAPPMHSTSVEPGKRRGSAMFESTARGGSDGNSTPPGLRKSKSDMTDWKSMSRNLQGIEFVELAPKQGTSVHSGQQLTEHVKLEGSDLSQVQLPSISSAKRGRRSPKDLVYPMPVTTSAAENKQPNDEPRVDLGTLSSRHNIEKQRLSLQSGQELSFDNRKRPPNQSLASLPSSPKDLAITSPGNSSGNSDVVAIATMTDLSLRSPDKTLGDVLPDLLLNCPPQEGHFSKQSGVSQQNLNSRTLKDATTLNSNSSAERSVASPSQAQQRMSPRLRAANLLPPLLINNRRSPTHEMEDGYFSCSPSPADVESPRGKYSNEQLRYSFKPISPRSPILSPKVFALQSGKQPSSR